MSGNDTVVLHFTEKFQCWFRHQKSVLAPLYEFLTGMQMWFCQAGAADNRA
jgi:hypothetical protein